MKSMTYSTSENVSAVNTIPVKVNRSRFTLIFFKAIHINYLCPNRTDRKVL